MYEQNLKDTAFETDVKNVVADKKNAEAKILSSTLRSGQKLQLDFQGADPTEFNAHLVGVQGVLINEQSVAADGTILIPANLVKGMYILAIEHHGQVQTFKVFVR